MPQVLVVEEPTAMSSRLNAKQQAAVAAKANNQEDKYYNITSIIDGKVSLLRCYDQDGPIFASSTSELPGTFAIWKFSPGSEDDTYTFTSYAFDSSIVADLSVGAKLTVSSTGTPVVFRLQPTSGEINIIKVTNEDLVWTIASSGDKREVSLEKANGSNLQLFQVKETTPC
ncbi:hypothetical protein AURDEDRAFT_173453 [Auricularia subglabra TFB-10046 SS5]|nr:hypothetical protein AURDEDRAFT_173453 [Auricularia subglabra TFB-10046 SS5]